MKPGVIVAGVIGILVGAGGLWLLARKHVIAPTRLYPDLYARENARQIREVIPPILPPTNAPIVVRGGSVEADAQVCWVPNGSDPAVSSYVANIIGPNLFLYIDNVTVPTPKPLKLNSEWTMTLTFTDVGPVTHSIKLHGTTPSSEGIRHAISMQGDNDGRWINLGSCPGYAKFYNSMNYQVQHCGGSPGQYGSGQEPACNHLSQIQIGAGSLEEADTETTYNCIPPKQLTSGQYCTIGLATED
jgi:hypothetical protein